ncbi:MAG: SDR family NAD(P)-dependent oxidoreductase [Arachnia sp.]
MSTALITGGTSGIGLAFARELASRGTDLVLVARDAQRLGEVAAELQAQHGVTVETLSADLSDRADMTRVARRVESDDAPIDMLINNAGFGLHSTVLDAVDVDTHAKALDVMCLALLVLGGAAGRAMRDRGRGQIINVASSSSVIFTGNYSAVKAWARTYSTSLALELRNTGVTVTALLPGWVRTEFHERAGITAHSLPDIVWIDTDVLVRECLADVDKGKLESIPTWKWKAAMLLADHGPRAFIRWFSIKLTNSRKKR